MTSEKAPLLHADWEILRHMLGVGSHIPKRQWGHRNYFNAEPGHGDMPSLERLEAAGLIKKYRPHFWCCTDAGMKVAGLTPAQMKKAKQS